MLSCELYDYRDKGGENVVKAWLSDRAAIHARARASIQAKLNILEASAISWKMPRTEVLEGGDGLIAIRIEYDKVAYRLIGCRGPGQHTFTILNCGKEKNGHYRPPDIIKKAGERRVEVVANPKDRRERHDFR